MLVFVFFVIQVMPIKVKKVSKKDKTIFLKNREKQMQLMIFCCCYEGAKGIRKV